MVGVDEQRRLAQDAAMTRSPVSVADLARFGEASAIWLACLLVAQAFRQACGHSRHGQQVDQSPGGPRQ
jgi:hypothetical protein